MRASNTQLAQIGRFVNTPWRVAQAMGALALSALLSAACDAAEPTPTAAVPPATETLAATATPAPVAAPTATPAPTVAPAPVPDPTPTPRSEPTPDGPRTDTPEPSPAETPPAAVSSIDGVLLHGSGDAAAPVLDVRSLPQVWDPINRKPSADGFGVGAESFGVFAPSPDGRWIAWATGGTTHTLVGVVAVDAGLVTVLDFVFDGAVEGLVWAPDSAYLAGALLSPAGPVVEVYRIGGDFEFAGPPRIVDELGPGDGWTTSAPHWRSARVLEFSAHNEISRQEAGYVLDLAAGEIRPA